MTRPDNRISTVSDGEMQEFKKNLGLCGFTADDLRMFNANIPEMKQWVEDGRGRLGNLWTTREYHRNLLTPSGLEVSRAIRIMLSDNLADIQRAQEKDALAIIIREECFERFSEGITTHRYVVGDDRWQQTAGNMQVRRSGPYKLLLRTKN